jgi:hypothetical protein
VAQEAQERNAGEGSGCFHLFEGIVGAGSGQERMGRGRDGGAGRAGTGRVWWEGSRGRAAGRGEGGCWKVGKLVGRGGVGGAATSHACTSPRWDCLGGCRGTDLLITRTNNLCSTSHCLRRCVSCDLGVTCFVLYSGIILTMSLDMSLGIVTKVVGQGDADREQSFFYIFPFYGFFLIQVENRNFFSVGTRADFVSHLIVFNP